MYHPRHFEDIFRINGREVSSKSIKSIKGETRKALAAAPGFKVGTANQTHFTFNRIKSMSN
ncbi:TPA: hypothetical protein DCP77_01190 [Candidatus Collierbacteria bacterium]|nr:hypothetical protein [Candidatus Collierbacteria bacterium]HAN22386.1 hypothetical protein [Candidatus Collierbacteria bacterium]